MAEDFLGCENFCSLRNFAGCESSQPGTVHLLLLPAPLCFYNPPFDAPEINFYNLLSHSN